MKPILKFGAVVIVIMIAGYFWFREKTQRDAEKAKEELRIEGLREQVRVLSQSVDAVDDWEDQLVGEEDFRTKPVLTAELQAIWLTDKPFLFIGLLDNAIQLADGDYQLSIRYFRSTYFFIDVRADLRCSAEITDGIIRNRQPDLSPLDGIAIIASFESITSETYLSEDNVRVEEHIGHGECIGAIYLGSDIIHF